MENNNLPSTETQTELLPFSPEVLESKKCSTALAAYRVDSPSIAKIKKDFDLFKLELGITFILTQLFEVRYSKLKMSSILVENFTSWILAEYFYMNLQEIELALLGSRMETYHVVDLEALKRMIEDYQAKRVEAVQQSKQNPVEVLGLGSGLNSKGKESNPIPMPEKTKKLINVLAIKGKERKKPTLKPSKDLEECLKSQGFTDSSQTAINMREAWHKEYLTIKATAIENNLEKHIEDWKPFLKKKETYFIKISDQNQQNK